ncbi:rCG36037 [Rattus norvegicus]|uniref:RCG36037 n=1 Tax=Rattus norvegicus TaxID=10116 RepID=A6IKU5_RAT|nr:rCG36037 [Rattus norvegicus]
MFGSQFRKIMRCGLTGSFPRVDFEVSKANASPSLLSASYFWIRCELSAILLEPS